MIFQVTKCFRTITKCLRITKSSRKICCVSKSQMSRHHWSAYNEFYCYLFGQIHLRVHYQFRYIWFTNPSDYITSTEYSSENCRNAVNCLVFNPVSSFTTYTDLVEVDMTASCSCYRFVGWTSTWIFCSTPSHSWSIGLRPGDCGSHLSAVNSSSCLR